MIDGYLAGIRAGVRCALGFAVAVGLGVLVGGPATAGEASEFHSSDVPKAIPDNDVNGVNSTLTVQGLGAVGDVDVILDDLMHGCTPDLHIELTSPGGTTVTLINSSLENGILAGLSCPANFIGTVLDDESPMGLRDGVPPYTGRFSVTHESVGVRPLSRFIGENGDGVWTLNVSDRNADDIGTLNGWGLALVPAPPPAFASADVPKDIPDYDSAGISSTLEVPVSGSIEDLDLVLDNVSHTCVADLHFELRSPAGTTVVLIRSANGEADGILEGKGCPDNFIGTVLSDQATVNLVDGIAPYTGPYNVEHTRIDPMPLSRFNGENVRGTWRLTIMDNGVNDVGSLNAWSLRPRLAPALPCDGDFDHSGAVTIDELIKAVGNALRGCP